MNLTCEVQEKIGKDGQPYYCLYIREIEKIVFLTKTEVKLLSFLVKKPVQDK